MAATISCRSVCLFGSFLAIASVALAIEPASTKLIQKTYCVADLMLNQDGSTRLKPTELINQVKRAIAPDTWSDVGGFGTVEYFPLGMTLFISQTRVNQCQIADRLSDMRWVREAAVATEVQIVTLPTRLLEQIKRDVKPVLPPFISDFSPAPPPKGYIGTPTAIQLARIMEAVDKQAHAKILQFPRVTAEYGKGIGVHLSQNGERVSGDLGVNAIVSLDRRHVELSVDVCRSIETQTRTSNARIQAKMKIASGETILWELGKLKPTNGGRLKQQSTGSFVLIRATVTPPPPEKPVNAEWGKKVVRLNNVQRPQNSKENSSPVSPMR